MVVVGAAVVVVAGVVVALGAAVVSVTSPDDGERSAANVHAVRTMAAATSPASAASRTGTRDLRRRGASAVVTMGTAGSVGPNTAGSVGPNTAGWVRSRATGAIDAIDVVTAACRRVRSSPPDTGGSIAANASPSGGRSAGRLAIARAMTPRSAGGTVAGSGGGACCVWAKATLTAASPSNGGRPVRAS